MLKINNIYCGDCLKLMKDIDDNSIDAVITDPPYELGFMGKHWDTSGITYNVSMWQECLRVLKPGGYLLSFGGNRTYHRMACAIEDAGFEIRDMIEWIYGSGFPKSLNMGKAIDKLQGNKRETIGRGEAGYNVSISKIRVEQGYRPNLTKSTREFDLTKGTSEFEGWGTALKPAHESVVMARKPLTAVPLYDILSMVIKTIGGVLCRLPLFVKIAEKDLKSNLKELGVDVSIAQWIADDNINIQDALSVLMDMSQLASRENTNWNNVSLWLNILKDLCGLMSKFTTLMETALIIELKILNSLAWQDIFQNITNLQDSKIDGLNVNVLTAVNLFNVVRLKLNHILIHSAQDPAIFKDELSDLRPNHNPIVVARKPLSEKTVAENVLRWGTGGINIDECRVGLNGEPNPTGSAKRVYKSNQYTEDKIYGENKETPSLGRFPANLIHDGSDEVMAEFPNGKSGSGFKGSQKHMNMFSGFKGNSPNPSTGGDSGSAARFFYCAKASKAERDRGLDDMPEIIKGSNFGNDGPRPHTKPDYKYEAKIKNNHPTVKPIKLMEYLVTLVTKENYLVLDPFCGSGTTLMACNNLGRSYIGIDNEADYVEIANKRLANTYYQEELIK